jgi:hypothetical protein
MSISVTDPIGPAINRAGFMTFKPFELGRWFVIGFVAFLAQLGSGGGGGNFNIRWPGGGGPRRPPGSPDPLNQAWNWVMANLPLVLSIAVVVILLVVTLWLLILWIGSRGKFMFIHAVATNRAEVVAPWKQYRRLGNSLMWFHVGLGAIGWIAILIIGASVLLVAWPDIQARDFGPNAVNAVILGAVMFVPTVIVLGLVSWATNTFVTVIMYAGGIGVLAAWREFRANVLHRHVGAFLLFLLMQIVFGIAIIICQFILGCATLCLGFLPYLSTVVALPLHIFMRCYSIYFMQQFGPPYVIIQEPVAAVGFPVIGVQYPHQQQPPYPPYPPQHPQ